MSISQGVAKQTRLKRQSGKGTLAGASGAYIIRRQQSIFELKKDTFDTSAEIISAQQLTSVQHGVKEVTGSINGLLSPGTYADVLSALVRRDFTAVTAITGASLTIAGTGPTYTVTRGTGSFLSDGIKVGYVVRLSVGTLNAANISKNLMVTAVTATVLTVIPLNGVALIAEGPITGCTVTCPGKVTFAPASGHTKIYYTVEEWMPDVPASEVNQDVRFGSAQITLPGTGNSTIQLSATGLDQTGSASAYFTTPTAETSADVVSAPAGVLLVNGVPQLIITNAAFTISGNMKSADGVVGSVVRPDVFVGKVTVEGSLAGYLDSTTVGDLFRNATDISLVVGLPNATTAGADFITFTLPRLKLTSNTPDDNETGLKRTYNFKAEYNAAGGTGIATEQTTIQIQDSLAA